MHLDDAAWLQASLHVKAGRIGIRSTVQLEPSAYLASAASCTIVWLLPPHLQDIPHSNVEAALSIWSLGQDQPPPPPSYFSYCFPLKSLGCSQGIIEAAFNALLTSSPVATSDSGAWLNAFPMSS